jgi:glycosyltransferase involved in cell wall biosynthesis
VRSSGIDDIIIDEYNGFKTDDDALEWSNRVIQMLENPELLKEMSKNAYNYSKTFTMDQMTKKVESLYYQVIDK